MKIKRSNIVKTLESKNIIQKLEFDEGYKKELKKTNRIVYEVKEDQFLSVDNLKNGCADSLYKFIIEEYEELDTDYILKNSRLCRQANSESIYEDLKNIKIKDIKIYQKVSLNDRKDYRSIIDLLLDKKFINRQDKNYINDDNKIVPIYKVNPGFIIVLDPDERFNEDHEMYYYILENNINKLENITVFQDISDDENIKTIPNLRIRYSSDTSDICVEIYELIN